MKLLVVFVSASFLVCNDGQVTTGNSTSKKLKKDRAYESMGKLDTPKMMIPDVVLYGEESCLQEIKRDEKVIEALITDARVLYVSVRDEGISKNSYAEYLCAIVAEFKANITKVKVVKAVSTPMKNKPEGEFGVLLGEANCK